MVSTCAHETSPVVACYLVCYSPVLRSDLQTVTRILLNLACPLEEPNAEGPYYLKTAQQQQILS